MSDARRRAEEALAAYDACKGYECDIYAMECVPALRAFLAEPAPACGSVSIVRSDDPPAAPLPTCANCGSNLIAPAPSPARDEVREAAEKLWHRLTPPASTTENGCACVPCALSRPLAEEHATPAPSTDLWRACGCADPDNCEHVYYDPPRPEPAPPAPDAVREAAERLRADDVEWVVNSLSELGVKIGAQFFFLYKGESLVYRHGDDEDGPLLWRHVGKREFGECCHPINDADPTRYGTVDVNDGREWRPLLAALDARRLG